jgi:2-haloacid dehalogenase
MNNSRKAILFDFGNVLVNWDVHRIFDRFFADPAAVDSFLTEVHYPEWNVRLDAGLPFVEGVAELAGQFPQYAHIIHAYDTDWDKGIAGPIRGTVDILHRLKQAGYPLYILSNFPL